MYVYVVERERVCDENRNKNRLQVFGVSDESFVLNIMCIVQSLHGVLCINVKVQCGLTVCEAMRVHKLKSSS